MLTAAEAARVSWRQTPATQAAFAITATAVTKAVMSNIDVHIAIIFAVLSAVFTEPGADMKHVTSHDTIVAGPTETLERVSPPVETRWAILIKLDK